MDLKRAKELAIVGIPFALTLLVSAILQITVLARPEQVQAWLLDFGIWFVFVYIIAQTLTIIIPPLGGLVFQLGAVAILGPTLGVILIYLVSTPAFCINFFLARKYGRPLVERMIGKTGMAKFDQLTLEAGVGTLVVLKVLQGGYFDYVSYAAGISKISTRDYLLINFIGGIPYSIISFLIYSKTQNLVQSVIVLQVLAGVLIALSFAINHFRNKKTAA